MYSAAPSKLTTSIVITAAEPSSSATMELVVAVVEGTSSAVITSTGSGQEALAKSMKEVPSSFVGPFGSYL